MKRRRVEISERAGGDLFALYDWVAEASGPPTALADIERLEAYAGDSIWLPKGAVYVRISGRACCVVGFERRVAIAFVVEDDRVVILRIFYGGQDWSEGLDE